MRTPSGGPGNMLKYTRPHPTVLKLDVLYRDILKRPMLIPRDIHDTQHPSAWLQGRSPMGALFLPPHAPAGVTQGRIITGVHKSAAEAGENKVCGVCRESRIAPPPVSGRDWTHYCVAEFKSDSFDIIDNMLLK